MRGEKIRALHAWAKKKIIEMCLEMPEWTFPGWEETLDSVITFVYRFVHFLVCFVFFRFSEIVISVNLYEI